jgi:uncharacterized protein (TIGR03382 family)
MSTGVGVMWWSLLVPVSVALAGYGDAQDGLPSHADREVVLWTNTVRIDPASLRAEYPCNFDSFSGNEKTSKPPLRIHPGLTEVAYLHSEDMRTEGYFSHDSNDGTSWDRRVRQYYPGGTIGENIAYGYADPFDAVIRGWMCSSGHRANIMSSNYEEIGAGVYVDHYTQDFGAGGGTPERAMTIGLHLPQRPGAQVDFAVDWSGTSGPDAIYVVVGGVRHDLALAVGTEQRGLFSARVPAGSGCQPYHFVAELNGRTETFPEDGAYGFGSCAWDDPGAEWLAAKVPLGDEEEPEEPVDTGTEEPPPSTGTEPTAGDTGSAPTATDAPTSEAPTLGGCGCDGTGGGGVAGVVAALLLAVGRRRR